jgi:hypothetical protein
MGRCTDGFSFARTGLTDACFFSVAGPARRLNRRRASLCVGSTGVYTEPVFALLFVFASVFVLVCS